MNNFLKRIRSGLAQGIGIGAGLLAVTATALLAQTVLHEFKAGDTLSASQMNENFEALNNSQVPVGAIIAWHKSLSGTLAVPANWVECNGQVLDDADSPYDGQTIPDLNNSGRFLRGAMISGTMQQDAFQGHSHWKNQDHLAELILAGPGGSNHTFYGCCDWMNWLFRGETGEPKNRGYGEPREADETRPVNMSVVWVIKVK